MMRARQLAHNHASSQSFLGLVTIAAGGVHDTKTERHSDPVFQSDGLGHDFCKGVTRDLTNLKEATSSLIKSIATGFSFFTELIKKHIHGPCQLANAGVLGTAILFYSASGHHTESDRSASSYNESLIVSSDQNRLLPEPILYTGHNGQHSTVTTLEHPSNVLSMGVSIVSMGIVLMHYIYERLAKYVLASQPTQQERIPLDMVHFQDNFSGIESKSECTNSVRRAIQYNITHMVGFIHGFNQILCSDIRYMIFGSIVDHYVTGADIAEVQVYSSIPLVISALLGYLGSTADAIITHEESTDSMYIATFGQALVMGTMAYTKESDAMKILLVLFISLRSYYMNVLQKEDRTVEVHIKDKSLHTSYRRMLSIGATFSALLSCFVTYYLTTSSKYDDNVVISGYVSLFLVSSNLSSWLFRLTAAGRDAYAEQLEAAMNEIDHRNVPVTKSWEQYKSGAIALVSSYKDLTRSLPPWFIMMGMGYGIWCMFYATSLAGTMPSASGGGFDFRSVFFALFVFFNALLCFVSPSIVDKYVGPIHLNAARDPIRQRLIDCFFQEDQTAFLVMKNLALPEAEVGGPIGRVIKVIRHYISGLQSLDEDNADRREVEMLLQGLNEQAINHGDKMDLTEFSDDVVKLLEKMLRAERMETDLEEEVVLVTEDLKSPRAVVRTWVLYLLNTIRCVLIGGTVVAIINNPKQQNVMLVIFAMFCQAFNDGVKVTMHDHMVDDLMHITTTAITMSYIAAFLHP